MPAGLGDLPLELLQIIIASLGPKEIMRVHSTSRSLRAASDQRYTMFFFQTLLVFVDEPGLERLEAIAQNECRKRVRTIAFSLHQPDPGLGTWSDRFPDAPPLADDSDSETLSMSESERPVASGTTRSAAAEAVSRAMKSFENCVCVSVEPGYQSPWTSSHGLSDFSCESWFNRDGRRHWDGTTAPMHHIALVIQTALTAAAHCPYARRFMIQWRSGARLNNVSVGMLFEHDYRACIPSLDHIQELRLRTDRCNYHVSRGAAGMKGFVDLFASVKTYEVSFNEYIQIFTKDEKASRLEMRDLLIDGIRSLTLECIACDPICLTDLIRDPRARSVRELTLSDVNVYNNDHESGLESWLEVLRAICCHMELSKLHVICCSSNAIELVNLGQPNIRTTKARSEFVYYNLNKLETERVLRDFVNDLREGALSSQASHCDVSTLRVKEWPKFKRKVESKLRREASVNRELARYSLDSLR